MKKAVKRAGLDYWDKLDYTIYDSYPDFLEKIRAPKFTWRRQKQKHIYSDVSFEEDCYIMFGKESAGIPEEILVENEETTIRFRCMARFDRSIWVILLQLFCTKHSGAKGLSGTQSDGGIFIILIGMMARYRKLQRELFEKSSLFATFSIVESLCR